MTGIQQAWLYRTAFETGFRASELLTLTPRSFARRTRHVVLDAKLSKRRKLDEQPVPQFHALRHSYITRLMRNNVPPKVMQKLARHSTIQLPLDRYSHLSLADPAAAIDSLPALTTTPKARRATA